MGNRLVKFNVTPGENEQIDAVIKVPKETRSVIHGVVLDECNKRQKDAVVKLFKVCNRNNNVVLEPITHTFTDEYGQFLFGPLCPHVKYVIKVWVNNVKTRELVIKPEECERECIGDKDCDHNHDHNKCDHDHEHIINEICEDE